MTLAASRVSNVAKRTSQSASLILAAALGVSCALNLISNYDQATDQGVAELQQRVDAFLVRLGRESPPECSYANRSDFYPEATVRARALLIRNRARDKNALTVLQLELLESSLATLEARHKLGCPQPAEIEVLRRNFATSFTAILRLELAKTRARQ